MVVDDVSEVGDAAGYKNPDKDSRGPWKAMDYTCRFTAEERPNLFYPIQQPCTGEEVWPKRTRVWAMSREVHLCHEAKRRICGVPEEQIRFPH